MRSLWERGGRYIGQARQEHLHRSEARDKPPARYPSADWPFSKLGSIRIMTVGMMGDATVGEWIK